MKGMGEYLVPESCEACESKNIHIRVIYESGICRYICEDCGYSRCLPKQENLKARYKSSMHNWAKQIIKFRPYCAICGAQEELEAHHIIPVSHSKEYAYMYTNGLTLCKKHHYLVHHTEDGLKNEDLKRAMQEVFGE